MAEPDDRFGFWTTSGSGRIDFPPPGGPYDAMTPLFRELWEARMGRHVDEDGDGIADAAQTGLEQSEYVYTDPVEDETWPRIASYDPDDAPDAFPEGWGGQPTERDQAAIDAGNA